MQLTEITELNKQWSLQTADTNYKTTKYEQLEDISNKRIWTGGVHPATRQVVLYGLLPHAQINYYCKYFTLVWAVRYTI